MRAFIESLPRSVNAQVKVGTLVPVSPDHASEEDDCPCINFEKVADEPAHVDVIEGENALLREIEGVVPARGVMGKFSRGLDAAKESRFRVAIEPFVQGGTRHAGCAEQFLEMPFLERAVLEDGFQQSFLLALTRHY